MLREYFDEIICLSCKERPDGYSIVSEQLAILGDDQPIKFEVGTDHIDIEPPDNWNGTKQSYNYYHCMWKIVQMAKDNKWDNFLFLEDDAWFQRNFAEVFNNGMEQLGDSDIDMLYLGANHHLSFTYITYDNIIRPTCPLDMHAVVIYSGIYDDILALEHCPNLHENPYLDINLGHTIPNIAEVYAFYPNIVYQFPSYKDGRLVDRTHSWQSYGLITDRRNNYYNYE